MTISADCSESAVVHEDQHTTRSVAHGDSKQPSVAFSRNALWRLHAGFASDTGARPANEDCGYANVREGLFLVADGVGGHFGGAVASHLLIDNIPPLILPVLQGSDVLNDELEEHIRHAVCAARTAMAELASREPSFAEMGSTIAMGVIAGTRLYVTHLGDSRVYLVRQGTIKPLTKDHSFVQTLMDAGILTSAEAKQHPWHKVITELVCAKRQSRVAVATHELLPGDRLLFATDGLTDVVEDDLLGWTITNLAAPQHTADALVRQALNNGSRDNVTCLVVHVDPAQGRQFQKRSWFARKSTMNALPERVR